MAAISGIEPVGASQNTPHRDQKGGRASIDFGAAVTHREMVSDKLRVDPAALAEKKRASRSLRSDDEPLRESMRDKRMAQDRAEMREAHEEHLGRHLDIRA